MNKLEKDRKLWSKHRISGPEIVEPEKLDMIRVQRISMGWKAKMERT